MILWRVFAVKFQAERLEPLNLNSVPTTFPKNNAQMMKRNHALKTQLGRHFEGVFRRILTTPRDKFP
jgi:hypothetical protein